MVVGIVVAMASVLGYQSVVERGKWKWLLFVLMAVVVLFQVADSGRLKLFDIGPIERAKRQVRTSFYPKFHLAGIKIPVAYGMEKWIGTIVLSRLSENLSEAVNWNLYFFAGHPRERVGVSETERISFFYLPIFVLGTFALVKEFRLVDWFFLVGIPLIVLTLWGSRGVVGPIAMMPFINIAISWGFRKMYAK